MITVRNLTKRFLTKTAIEGISFDVDPGEIVGFLGPNGAGKTTTMRILTTYLPATSGSVTVAGCDIFTDSLALRSKIGYMPESVPLYTDLRVKEYLHFRASLRGLSGRNMRRRVGAVMDTCGLHEVRKSMIGTLSKGYRQRVGLADALVHEPDLLILDEPTNGLDPNQIRQVRELIKQLAEDHTILLSTHILGEVQMTCGRVIILDEGNIKAADTPANLISRLRAVGTVTLEVKVSEQAAINAVASQLDKIRGVKKVSDKSTSGDWTSFTLKIESNTDVRQQIFETALAEKWTLRELTQQIPSLEDVFVHLTEPLSEN